MKVVKRPNEDIEREEAHGGSGSRKVYASAKNVESDKLEAITHGFLPGGQTFDWHNHEGVEEIMVVLKGAGMVSDEDGEYDYKEGDVYIFPPSVEHKIHNPTEKEHEIMFIRIKV